MIDTELLVWTMVCIVGTVGVVKNFISSEKLGRRFWSLITLVIGSGIAFVATKMPIVVLQVWVAVTGATLFYDTIFKAFQKLISRIGMKVEE